MKHTNTLLALCVVALGLAPQSQAQCPTGVTNPIQALTGTWTFHFKGSSFTLTTVLSFAVGDSARVAEPKAQGVSLSSVFAAAGVFSASSGGNTGILNVTDTTDGFQLNTQPSLQPIPEYRGVTRTTPAPHFVGGDEKQTGKFQIFPDCSGGTLTFTMGTKNLSFDFWFAKGFTEMYFVSNDGVNLFSGIATKS